MIKFSLLKKNKKARLGKLNLKHGEVETPAFMTVGTHGSVKLLSSKDIKNCNAQIILCNAYHLMLRPGNKIIEAAGGLHKFMSWNRPILTDSGGYQVFSLSSHTNVTKHGVEFKSPLNGEKIFISPEISIETQINLGSDIMMIFDECTSYPSTKYNTKKSMELSLYWAELSFKHNTSSMPLFGIVQGGMFPDLRDTSLNELLKFNFDGYAIGGLSVGEPSDLRNEIVSYIAPKLPEAKPRYLMGVGKPLDIIYAVRDGIDMFDCVIPTRNARNGQIYSNSGIINIRNKKYEQDFTPIDKNCNCSTCQTYSKSYIRHLDKCNDALAGRLMTIHNVYFYQEFMGKIRTAIHEDNLEELISEMEIKYKDK